MVYINFFKNQGGLLSFRKDKNKESIYEVNITLLDAFKSSYIGRDSFLLKRFILAHTILFSMEGIPAVYIQNLVGTANDYEKVKFTKSNRSINRKNSLANKENKIVLGTGDLSEIALGWCTFNGDHMSSYNVNASIPKTLVKYLVEYFYYKKDIKSILKDIVDTKISPELIKNKTKDIVQSTEDIIGPYFLHDFFLYHYIKNGHSWDKIEFLAKQTFEKLQDIEKWINVFKTRFKVNQFKRTTVPPGPKVGTVSLSPRGDWRMPDES